MRRLAQCISAFWSVPILQPVGVVRPFEGKQVIGITSANQHLLAPKCRRNVGVKTKDYDIASVETGHGRSASSPEARDKAKQFSPTCEPSEKWPLRLAVHDSWRHMLPTCRSARLRSVPGVLSEDRSKLMAVFITGGSLSHLAYKPKIFFLPSPFAVFLSFKQTNCFYYIPLKCTSRKILRRYFVVQHSLITMNHSGPYQPCQRREHCVQVT